MEITKFIIIWIGENLELIGLIIAGILLYGYVYNSATRNPRVYQAQRDEYYRKQYEELYLKKKGQKQNETNS